MRFQIISIGWYTMQKNQLNDHAFDGNQMIICYYGGKFSNESEY